MPKPLRASLWMLAFLSSASPAPGGETDSSPDQIKQRVLKSLSLIESSTAEYLPQRECFSCHHQAMPVLALAEARRRGFPIDADNFQKQLQRTVEHLNRGRAGYLEGRGQGGKADTAGYALWTLEAGDWKSDDTTSAVTQFLLAWHKDSDHWGRTSLRPPSEASDFTTTYLAVRALAVFGTDEQSDRIAQRTNQALRWLSKAETKDTEDRVFRLRALHYLGAEADAVQAAAKEVQELQRADGGWAQLPELASDAYATGTALVALCEAGGVSVTDPVYRRGVKFLIDSQLDDGSWRVVSRSKPFQTYFESGFPHGKDQFISITASCWAVQALLLTFPPADDPPPTPAVKPEPIDELPAIDAGP